MSFLDRVLRRLADLPGIRPLWVRYPVGSVPTRVRYDIWERPNYAYGIYSAADLARRLKIPAISVIEFGVAGGRGLIAMEKIGREIARHIGVRISCYGFDGGRGMPAPQDYRDIPYVWGEGFYGSVAESVGKRGRGKSHCVEKSKGGTFPLRLEIPQERRDFHFSHRPGYDELTFRFHPKQRNS